MGQKTQKMSPIIKKVVLCEPLHFVLDAEKREVLDAEGERETEGESRPTDGRLVLVSNLDGSDGKKGAKTKEKLRRLWKRVSASISTMEGRTRLWEHVAASISTMRERSTKRKTRKLRFGKVSVVVPGGPETDQQSAAEEGTESTGAETTSTDNAADAVAPPTADTPAAPPAVADS